MNIHCIILKFQLLLPTQTIYTNLLFHLFLTAYPLNFISTPRQIPISPHLFAISLPGHIAFDSNVNNIFHSHPLGVLLMPILTYRQTFQVPQSPKWPSLSAMVKKITKETSFITILSISETQEEENETQRMIKRCIRLRIKCCCCSFICDL